MSARFDGIGRRLGYLGALLGFVVLDVSVASCASTESDQGPDEADSASPVPEVDASMDAGADACESNAEGCDDREPPPCDEVDWCLEKTSHPAGVGLAGVWGSGPNDVWAVGALGTVTHWDGKEWTSSQLDMHWSLRAIWGSGPNDVWTMAATNQIFRATGFANGKPHWSPVVPVVEEQDPPAPFGAIWGTSSKDVWIAGKSLFMQRENDGFAELAWRTTAAEDGGIEWAPALQDWYFEIVHGIWGSGADDVWVVGTRSNGVGFITRSSGAPSGEVPQWTELDAHSFAGLHAIWGSGPDDVWAVGDYGTIRRCSSATHQCAIIESPTLENLRGIWGSGPKDIWAVGERATLLHYDGTEWRTATGGFVPGTKPNLSGIWGSGPNDIWAVGSGIVIHYTGPKPGARGAKP